MTQDTPTTQELREIARQEARNVYENEISVQHPDGSRTSLPDIVDAISQLAPDLSRRETLQTAIVAFGYVAAGASISTALINALTEPASAGPSDTWGTQADPWETAYVLQLGDATTPVQTAVIDQLNTADVENSAADAILKAVGDGTLNFEGYIDTGSYTGDGTSSNSITGVGFEPKVLAIGRAAQTGVAYLTYTTMVGISGNGGAINLSTGTPEINTVASLDSDGFTVDDGGDDGDPNTNGQDYRYLAIG